MNKNAKNEAKTIVKDSLDSASGEDQTTAPLDKDSGVLIETEESARLKLYKRDDVRRLIGWMLGGHDEFLPQRSPETGGYVYLGKEFGLEDISALLNELESRKILRRSIIDTIPSCPSCQESNFNITYLCPYSQHSMLEHGTLIEHYACGNADFEINYRSGASELVCPKCRRTLKVIGTDYRKIERAYRCSGCGKSFGTPKLMLQCRNCNRRNDEEDLVMPPVYSFKINERLRSELISHCSLEIGITAFLEKAGFKVTAPTRMTGLSGVLHNFDMGAKNGSAEIVMDMVSAIDEVGPPQVVEFFAKVYDTKPAKSLLIALPKLGREAQRLGAMYGVEVIGAESVDEVKSKLSTFIETLGASASAPSEPDQDTSIVEVEKRPPEPSKPSIELRAASLIEQTIASLEKKTSDTPPPEVTREPRSTPPAETRKTLTKPPDTQSIDGDEILRKARERMKRLTETS